MKNKLLALNWKSNKTKLEAKDWLTEVSSIEIPETLKVVLFPPFTLLDIISGYIKVNSMPFKLGAQDVSPFEQGAYTGEVSAQQIKEFADYVIIGHSERRTNFNETNEVIRKKVDIALAANLTPIVCISKIEELEGLENPEIIFAFEPLESIGTGNATEPDVVEEMAKQMKNEFNRRVVYGGSVNSENIKEYLDLPSIEGALIGGESLSIQSVLKLVENAI